MCCAAVLCCAVRLQLQLHNWALHFQARRQLIK
jgi:hypothetical protein